MAQDSGTDEFAMIARWFAPLARNAPARGLLDDAALLELSGPVVLTADAIVEGVHFLPEDPLADVARKALRVNLSDLAAKAAVPLGYLLTLFWPDNRPAEQIGDFTAGLAADQAAFGLELWGGDTAATPGPLSISVTMLGRAGPRTPARADAQPGQDVWVSGAIGDSGLGLAALRGAIFPKPDADYLVRRYRLPEPRTPLAAVTAACAGAAMDVSDGLLADAGKIAAASGLALAIEADSIPLSPAARAWLARQADRGAGLAWLAGQGDDYEILLTAAPAHRVALEGAGFSRIGRTGAGQGVTLTLAGQPMAVENSGFVHRLGAPLRR